MKLKFIYILLLSFEILGSQMLFAQDKSFEISGKLITSENQTAIEFATIMLIENETDKAISGTSSDVNGVFNLKANSQDVYIKISFIGFESQTIKNISPQNGKLDLGIIALKENVKTLNEVEIRAEKSSTEFKLDKRIFNVGQDLSSTGASALEVLNNVPSVNVDIEGQISLRGSQGVQVLINGKPSVIASEQGNALGTITADMIDKIEVITNPSAKYDAEGTSGIINIIIKKEERKGINGSLTLNTGAPHNHSLGLSLNRRTEKFNLFSQIGVGYRNLPNLSENINRDLINNTSILTNGEESRIETFYNFILGADFNINKYNVITLSGNFAYEVEEQPSIINFNYQDANGNIISEWNREEETKATNPKWQYELQYKKDFKDHKEHDLLFSALGNFFGKDLTSEFTSIPIKGTSIVGNQQTQSDFKEARYTFKLDYTKPFSEQITLETGAQYVIQDVSNDFMVTDWEDGAWVADMSLTNLFNYDQQVLGAYSTGAYEGTKWGLKLGLRLENTNLNTLLAATNQANNQNYTNLFPSVHSSYKLTEAFSLQAGYSRRIFRPRLWDLNPFFNVRNNFSIRTGNPNLQPEFTDSYELMSIYALKDISFNFGAFHRYTTDVVERVSTFENGVNTTKPINIGTNRSTGIEFNTKYSPNKWFSINGDFNLLYFTRLGEFNGTNFDFNGNQYSSKLTSKFKLPIKLDIEITGHYQSKVKMIQGVQSGNLFADLGLRQKIMKGRGIISFSVRDIFASRIRENNTYQPNFYLYSRRQRGRFMTLGFSYGFGKGEAMEFSGSRRHH